MCGASYPASPRAIVRPLGMPLEQQIHHRGPVWLDHVDARSAAPYGLGAELQEHLARRHAQLQSLGIAPADPKRLDALRELERRAVGEGGGRPLGPVVPPNDSGADRMQRREFV